MSNVRHLKAVETVERETETGYVAPEYLQDFLPVTATRTLTFRSEKSLRAYRSMIYSINRQGDYRYRTLRDEQSMWGLLIYRMK